MEYREVKLLHENVFMPNWCVKLSKQLHKAHEYVELSRHFEEQHIRNFDSKHYMIKDKLLKAIENSKEAVSPFEVELTKYEENGKYFITKYVFRTPYDDERDVVVAVIPKYDRESKRRFLFVKTAWVNDKDDQHYTLDEDRYDKEV